MGKRVHVVKKHQEFGSYEAFDWKSEEFRTLLEDLGCNVCGEEFSDEYECDIDEYERALELVKADKNDITPDSRVVAGKFDDLDLDYNDYRESFMKLECDLDTLIQAMEIFHQQAEKDYGWISFSAW